MKPIQEFVSTVRTIQSHLEDAWAIIERDPTIGDDGIAELMTEIDNRLIALQNKSRFKRDATNQA